MGVWPNYVIVLCHVTVRVHCNLIRKAYANYKYQGEMSCSLERFLRCLEPIAQFMVGN